MSDSLDQEFAALGGKVRVNAGKWGRKGGHVSDATKLAKDLFLYGNGDGKPITNPARLAEKSGCSVRTIERHQPEWEKERRAIATSVNGSGLKLGDSVTGEMVQWQRDKAGKLREKCDALEMTLEKLTPGSKSYADTLKLLNLTLARWEESSGFASMADTQATYAKELARQAARLAAKPASAPVERQVTAFSFNTASAEENKG